MELERLQLIHEQFIRNQPDGAFVALEIFNLATLTDIVQAELHLASSKVHLKTKVLKHLYERRPASIYDFLLINLPDIVRFPDKVYRNPKSKKGNFVFVKEYGEGLFLVSIDTNAHPETGEEVNVVVTAFKAEWRYVEKYTLLWTWEGGDASS